ncbi:hypothetical protein CTAYLR_001194 [Chrysophaeum taylorii]|uniref:HIT-type domain-containing protein n=1 Tax=Chrysophaeum taylorii TaxID=2483200 RepID=A0AAD7UDB1_9STRA|nr:hypothetical protein CTAYLR_001194 [Chrysophaeum taylorii]
MGVNNNNNNNNNTRGQAPCVVCATVQAKYSCPRCRSPYCCVACCKEHKTKCAGAPPKPPRRQRQDLSEPKRDSHRLAPEHRRRLDAARWIHEELDRDPALRAIVETIDTAQNRPAALDQARKTNQKLASFVDRVLLDIGICEPSTDTPGGVVFVGVSPTTQQNTQHHPPVVS